MCDWKNNTEAPPPISELGSHRQPTKFSKHDLAAQEGLTWRLASIISRPANLQDHTFRAQSKTVSIHCKRKKKIYFPRSDNV